MAEYDFRRIRLFIADALDAGQALELEPDQSHYLARVMRVKEGQGLYVFNGRDGEWAARVETIGKKDVCLRVEALNRPQAGVPDLDFYFAPIKRAPIDNLVQKATELGVRRIRPVLTRHTVATRVNLDRMRANAREAAEQCGRLEVPTIDEPLDFFSLISTWDQDRRLIFCDEGGEAPPIAEALSGLAATPEKERWAILIGPEGGFHEEERAALRARKSVYPVSLGPRIMRADTAGLASLAIWQSLVGDWRSGGTPLEGPRASRDVAT